VHPLGTGPNSSYPPWYSPTKSSSDDPLCLVHNLLQRFRAPTSLPTSTWVSRYRHVKPFWDLLQRETTEVAVVTTTRPLKHTHLHLTAEKSNHHHQHTSNQMFYRQDALPAAQPTASKHWRRCKHLKACWLHHAWLPIRCLSHRALALAAGKWSPNVISDGQNPKHNWFLSRDFKWFHNSICTIKIQFEPVWFDLQFNSKISQIGLKKI